MFIMALCNNKPAFPVKSDKHVLKTSWLLSTLKKNSSVIPSRAQHCFSHQLRAGKGPSYDLWDHLPSSAARFQCNGSESCHSAFRCSHLSRLKAGSFLSQPNIQGLGVCDALREPKSQLWIKQLVVPQHVTLGITHPTMEGKNRMISYPFSLFGFVTIPLNACWATGSLCTPGEGRTAPDKVSWKAYVEHVTAETSW